MNAPSADSRSHELIGHTADVGFRVTARDVAGLFEEAAKALAELTTEVHGSPPSSAQAIEVRGRDIVALAYAYLNELIGVADARAEALVGAEIGTLDSTGGTWLVRGTARFTAYGPEVQPSLQAKAATLHRLSVDEGPDGWVLEAYVDV